MRVRIEFHLEEIQISVLFLIFWQSASLCSNRRGMKNWNEVKIIIADECHALAFGEFVRLEKSLVEITKIDLFNIGW